MNFFAFARLLVCYSNSSDSEAEEASNDSEAEEAPT